MPMDIETACEQQIRINSMLYSRISAADDSIERNGFRILANVTMALRVLASAIELFRLKLLNIILSTYRVAAR